MAKHKPDSAIDYLGHSEPLIGRPGYTHNIVTGCEHGCEYCYARRMVEHGFLKGNKAYPYGFEPTFHPERVKKIGGKPKLIFLNDMGDVGGDWNWKPINMGEWVVPHLNQPHTPFQIGQNIIRFALLNPQHIILLLTKNPAWYAYQKWPSNVWCGFTATTNEELTERYFELMNHVHGKQTWVSLEPWLDKDAPQIQSTPAWIVIGGLTGKGARPVSDKTLIWLDLPFSGKRFAKDNVRLRGTFTESPTLRQYPDEWRVTDGPTD